MHAQFNYLKKNPKQLKNWYDKKVNEKTSNFNNFEEFKDWYESQEKFCHYCGLTEIESQEVVITKKLESNRCPQDGKHGRGTSRAMWLEIDRYDPKGKYEISNIRLCCYFCNNDKSDIFHGDDYKIFIKDRVSYLKKLLLT